MYRWVGAGVLAALLAAPAAAQDWDAAIAAEGKRAYAREIAATRPAPGLELSLRDITPYHERDLTPGQLFAWHTVSTLADVASTHYVLARCDGCGEANPIMKPFVDRGPAATVAVSALYNWTLWFWRFNEQQLGHADHARQVESLIRMGSDAHYGASMSNIGILDR